MMKKPKMPKVGGGMKDASMAMPRFGARAMRPGGMAKGGKIHADAAMDKKLIRKEIARAEKMEHESEGKGAKKGGEVKKMFRGGQSTMPAAGPRGGAQTMPAPGPRGAPLAQTINDRPTPAAGPRRAPLAQSINDRPSPGAAPRGAPISGTINDRPMPGRQPLAQAVNNRPMPGMMKKGGYVKMARGGGVETKGKTKGRFI